MSARGDVVTGSETQDVVWDLDDAPAGSAARCQSGRRPTAPAAPAAPAPVREPVALGFSLQLTRQDGTRVVIRPGEEVWLGRHSSCGLPVADTTVSRFHAQVRWDAAEDRPVVLDAASQNGTRVGKQALRPHTPHVLHGGEELRLGQAPPLRVELRFAGLPAPALLATDSDETALFTDSGPCFAGTTHGQAELHRVLLVLEARRRTASVRIEGEGLEARLTFCLGKVVLARCGKLRGRDALVRVLQLARAALLVSRSFEPEEAELEASIRAVLAEQGEDTKRWARPAGEDLAETVETPSPFAKPTPTPPPVTHKSETLFTVEPAQVWKR
jgi:hypothetical protein